jgi:hypothetical protein
MITCPWCGTNYTAFQPSCDKCGGSLPLPPETAPIPSTASLPAPPPPPRNVPQRAVWHILFSDAWAVSSLIFSLLGLIFTVVGIPLAVSLVALFVGIPFTGIGLLFLGGGIGIMVWRYRVSDRTVNLLQEGDAGVGDIVSVSMNYQLTINGRHPWTVEYDYEVDGALYGGKVTTLSTPDLSQQSGSPVYVLYMPDDPAQSTIYPSPYGYYGL